jgi:hypothetical protein
MITIGIRAAPKTITFAIFDSDGPAVVNIEEIRVPAAFSFPDALKYVRSNLLDVMREFDVEQAGIRATEPSAQSFNIERVQIEGVIQEMFASSKLKRYYIGHISSISSKIGIERADFKPYVDGTKKYKIEGWEKLNPVQREALFCAMGAKNA